MHKNKLKENKSSLKVIHFLLCSLLINFHLMNYRMCLGNPKYSILIRGIYLLLNTTKEETKRFFPFLNSNIVFHLAFVCSLIYTQKVFYYHHSRKRGNWADVYAKSLHDFSNISSYAAFLFNSLEQSVHTIFLYV